jgi:hypothetical protein
VPLAPEHRSIAALHESRTALAGSWLVTVFEPDGPPTWALFTLAADGTMVASEHPVVTPPGGPGAVFTSTGHGAWETGVAEDVRFAYVGLGSDGQGSLVATVTCRGRLMPAADPDTLTGEMVATVETAEGGIAEFALRLLGTRITTSSPSHPAFTRMPFGEA